MDLKLVDQYSDKMIYIIAGVSGTGKTNIGRRLGEHLKIPFFDADDFHPEENINKMSQGIPLNDADRQPWLETLADRLAEWEVGDGAILACSALKEKYRAILSSKTNASIKWIMLKASKDILVERLANRKGHFFKPNLLNSQFNDLELPEYGMLIDVSGSKEEVFHTIIEQMDKAEIGLAGLGVMGQSLALNMAEKGLKVAVYNRHVDGKEVDVAKNFSEANSALRMRGFDDLEQFVEALQQPRKVFLMVNAGNPVDQMIEKLTPLLAPGDAIIDGGNSHYLDTARREKALVEKGILFLGAGVSGGEEGARKGPSIMPGGSSNAYKQAAFVLEAIAAKDKAGKACTGYIGPAGSGHFVKMIHNGIEYAEMQLLAEVYQYLRFFAGYDTGKISDLFIEWNNQRLQSYLLEITADILSFQEDGKLLLDKILDRASNKGTGGWSTEAAIALGQPLTTISEALMARFLSFKKEERLAASKLFGTPVKTKNRLTSEVIEEAVYLARLINHAIGFEVIREASKQYGWQLNLNEIARIWTNGCIIRSALMEELAQNSELSAVNLLLSASRKESIIQALAPLQEFVATALRGGCAVPVFSAALNYFLGLQSGKSSANLIQAQRDYFGAHTYQRVDDPSGKAYHTDWLKSKD